MKKKTIKLLALLLSLIMMPTLVPTTALAVGEINTPGENESAYITGISTPEAITIRYKDEAEIQYNVHTQNGFVEHFVRFDSANYDIVSVNSELGIMHGIDRGTTTVTTTVNDVDGNIFTDTTEVTVRYTWWQWIIKIVLFGWIWY